MKSSDDQYYIGRGQTGLFPPALTGPLYPPIAALSESCIVDLSTTASRSYAWSSVYHTIAAYSESCIVNSSTTASRLYAWSSVYDTIATYTKSCIIRLGTTASRLYACSSPQNPPATNVDAIVVASTTCKFQEDNCIIWKVPGEKCI